MIKYPKTGFEICCISHHTLCDVTFCCDLSRPRYFSKNQRARIIYSIIFIFNVFLWMFLKLNPEDYLFIFSSAYSCKVQFEFLSCFYVNMVLRSSLAFFMFHSWMFCFTIVNLRVKTTFFILIPLDLYLHKREALAA